MSYEKYVTYIAQKYRLAITLSVIRTKPANTNLEDYIQSLRDKINEDMNEPENLNVSLYSDDFHFDETNDFNININNNDGSYQYENDVSEVEITDTQDLNDFDVNMAENNGKNKESTDLDEVMHLVTNDVEMLTQDLNDSVTILQNFNVDDVDMDARNSFNDVMGILKGIDDGVIAKEAISKKTTPQSIHGDMLETQTSEVIDFTQSFTDNDATLCKSLDILPKEDSRQEHNYNLKGKQITTLKYIAVQKSVPKDDINTKSNNCKENNNVEKYQNTFNTECNIPTSSTETQSKCETKNNTSTIENKFITTKSKPQSKREYRHTNKFKNIYQNVADIFETDKNKTVHEVMEENESLKKLHNDSQDATCAITEEFTCKTHYSESQAYDYIRIDDKYIHGTNRHNKEIQNKHLEENTHCKNKDLTSQESLLTNFTLSAKSNHNCEDVIIDDKIMNRADADFSKRKVIHVDNDIFSQESQLTNFLTSSTNSELCDKNKEKYAKESDKILNKDINECSRHQNSVKSKAKYVDNDLFSQESQLTNFLTSSTQSSQCDKNKEKYAKESSKTLNKDINECSRHQNNVKSKATYVDNDLFSQESQLTNFLTSSTNSELCEKNKEKYAKESDKTLNKDINECSRHQNSVKSKAKYVDNDLFSQESQLTYFSTLPNDTQNNITEISLSLSKDAQKNEDSDCTEAQNSQVFIVANEKPKDNRSCTAFDKNFRNITNQRCNNIDENLVTEEVVANSTIEEQKSCANFDNNSDTLQVLLKKPCTKYDEKFKNITEGCTNFDNNLRNMEEDWTDSQNELIPFKVIEELNKVKMYVNRKNDKKMSLEGYSSDAGYKSDSQSKNSLRTSQTSVGWLDQSAHSLFNHIIDCPLVGTTQDITDEVSVVLGNLIDMLHEEERYPSFLEELLESVLLLLGLLYEENGEENMLLKKDESIQRILLLNKSIHIQKYTIDKITTILENLHTELTTNDLYEIQNITQIENICYVFHTLEIILQKYNKTSQNLSQSTQNSQEEEKQLKKSSIMDIWRKKWNPSYKVSQNEGSQEKQCVLSNCRAVLNKLVVGCMEGYSLVSYFALKCFNVMQT